MNQRIILADNSYTIRRIVELSFQDIERVELLSFENGIGLKDKLLELLPQVVLIDIKLPDFNGYEACKFINNEPSLVNTKVLLMKGGFEPIDEYLLKDLTYEDIITKPFDSKLLETQVVKLLKDLEGIAPLPPISIPEENLDIPTFTDNLDKDLVIETNIETESFPDNIPEFNEDQKNSGISFSDVIEDIEDTNTDKSGNDMDFEDAVSDIETPGVFSENELLNDSNYTFDKVEPSEEITQGAYEDSSDALSSIEPDTEFLNPFSGEPSINADNTDEINLKEHIKEHEDDLGIDSLTIEEMRIKSEIENRNKGIDKEEDYGVDTFGNLEKQPDFDNISFGENQDVAKAVKENEVCQVQEKKIDKSMFEAAEGILNDDISMLEEEKNISVKAPVIDEEIIATADTAKSNDFEGLFGSQEDSIVEDKTPKVEPVLPVLETKQTLGDIKEPMMSSTDFLGTDMLKDNVSFDSIPEIPKVDTVPIIEEKIEEPVVKDETINKQEDIQFEEKIEKPVLEQEDIQLEEKIYEPVVEQEEVLSNIPEESIIEESVFEKVSDEPIIEEIAKEIAEPKVESVKVDVDMKNIMSSVEDKLTIAIKEILWEVIPPLAEKIIKEEIAGLKSEIDNKEF